jgi:hypothetical protein
LLQVPHRCIEERAYFVKRPRTAFSDERHDKVEIMSWQLFPNVTPDELHTIVLYAFLIAPTRAIFPNNI